MRHNIFPSGLLILFAFFVGCGESTKAVTLSVVIKYQGNSLMIWNNDDFSYDQVKIELNEGKFKREFPLPIPARRHVEYDLSSFTKSDGERFNILKYSLNDIAISCEVTGEINGKWQTSRKAFYSGKFR